MLFIPVKPDILNNCQKKIYIYIYCFLNEAVYLILDYIINICFNYIFCF